MAKRDLAQEIAHIIAKRPKAVTAMNDRIFAALEERGEFERLKAPHGSHIEFRRAADALYGLQGNNRVSAFLVALNADPDLMLNRVRKDGTRSNLKGFTKIRKLVDYVTGKTQRLETVTLALFASTIIAAQMGVEWIASPEQELILSPEKVQSLPVEVQAAIRDFQHKHMRLTGDSRPQACQFRTTFENLGCFHQLRDNFYDNAYTFGISVVPSNPLVSYLSSRWGLSGN